MPLVSTFGLLIYLLAFAVVFRLYAWRGTFSIASLSLAFGLGSIGATVASLYLQSIPLPFLGRFAVWFSGDWRWTAAWTSGPIIEELAKAAPIFLLAADRRIARRMSVADFVLVGFVAGLAFTFVEKNFLGLAGRGASGWKDVTRIGVEIYHFPSGALVVAGHAVWTALVGLGVGVGAKLWPDGYRRWAMAWAALAYAAFEHAMSNYILLRSTSDFEQDYVHAAQPWDMLFGLTLKGSLGVLLLLGGLALASRWETRRLAAAGDDADLRLPGETGRSVWSEARLALARAAMGWSALGRGLTYFRARRAVALAEADARSRPDDHEAAAFATAAHADLARAVPGVAVPQPSSWLPSAAAVGAVASTLMKRYWIAIGLAMLLAAVFAVSPGLFKVLHGPAARLVLGLGSAAFVGWRLIVYLRSKAPDPAAAAGEALAIRRLQSGLLTASTAVAALGLLAALLKMPAILPGGAFAYISGLVSQWAGAGGSTGALVSVAGAAGAGLATGVMGELGCWIGMPETLGLAPVVAQTLTADQKKALEQLQADEAAAGEDDALEVEEEVGGDGPIDGPLGEEPAEPVGDLGGMKDRQVGVGGEDLPTQDASDADDGGDGLRPPTEADVRRAREAARQAQADAARAAAEREAREAGEAAAEAKRQAELHAIFDPPASDPDAATPERPHTVERAETGDASAQPTTDTDSTTGDATPGDAAERTHRRELADERDHEGSAVAQPPRSAFEADPDRAASEGPRESAGHREIREALEEEVSKVQSGDPNRNPARVERLRKRLEAYDAEGAHAVNEINKAEGREVSLEGIKMTSDMGGGIGTGQAGAAFEGAGPGAAPGAQKLAARNAARAAQEALEEARAARPQPPGAQGAGVGSAGGSGSGTDHYAPGEAPAQPGTRPPQGNPPLDDKALRAKRLSEFYDDMAPGQRQGLEATTRANGARNTINLLKEEGGRVTASQAKGAYDQYRAAIDQARKALADPKMRSDMSSDVLRDLRDLTKPGNLKSLDDFRAQAGLKPLK